MPSRDAAPGRAPRRSQRCMLARRQGPRLGEARRMTTAAPLEPVLELRDVTVHFGGRSGFFARPAPSVKAVEGVDLTVAPGETVGLVGESGCGKSTLSNAIVGLLPPTRGSIRVRGQEVVGADASTLKA